MVDNVPITPGSGRSIATDDIGSVHFQRVKPTHGADGTATDSSDTAPFPIKAITASGGNGTASTQATGTNWTTLTAQACTSLCIGNNSGTIIEFRQGGA